jgi:hypothetical protein
MTVVPGPEIFWTTLASVTAVLFLATLIGRACSLAFPRALKGIARFYLAPALGLASLTIVASMLGRVLPLGNSAVVTIVVIALLAVGLFLEQSPRRAAGHALLVSIFGIACGASMLAPLFAYGGFSAHNDAFTYLVHSNWLQEHALREAVLPEALTPRTTQIALYQQEGLRMGASFLLALLQGLAGFRWSYEIYPAVVIAAVATCCLAVGFPLARALRPMRRSLRLALLALPAFSLGGLVFGADFGFLPQTIGLALGASLLFAVGPLLRPVASAGTSGVVIAKAAVPCAILFAGATLAYTELAPFVLVAMLGSGLAFALRWGGWARISLFGCILVGLSILLLNVELVRAYAALRAQSRAVVGSPVDWTLLGYVAHAFGVHGGAWDMFQWTRSERPPALSLALGWLLLGLSIGATLAGARSIGRSVMSGALMPALAATTVFMLGILYFRFLVPSPFPKGVGQSWSQFKLSEWAHPFIVAFALLASTALRGRSGRVFDGTIVALFTIGLVAATLTGVARAAPLMQYYSGVKNLNRFYLGFRDAVLAHCPADMPVYLALGGNDLKFRQMAVLYLYDREVTSDWTDDGYIFPWLPTGRRRQELTRGSCVVEPAGHGGRLSHAEVIGPVQVGIFDGSTQVRIVSVTGAYERESDGRNSWHWVEHRISFKFPSSSAFPAGSRTRLCFEYATRGNQTLTVRVSKQDGLSQEIRLRSTNDALATFDKINEFPASELAEVSIETDGEAYSLGGRDARMAAMIIRNVSVASLPP